MKKCTLPLKNKYSYLYYNIINKAKEEFRNKSSNCYFESHHIYPKCLGGNDKKINLVLLTAREHFLCHWLLTKMFDNKYIIIKMQHAFTAMSFLKSKRKINSKNYEILSNYHSKVMKKINAGKIPWNKGLKGKQEAWNKGLILPKQSEEVKKRKSNTLKKHWQNNKHNRIGQAPWNKGLKGKQEAWNKGISPPEWICPYCKKKGKGQSNYIRWHGNQCKFRTA